MEKLIKISRFLQEKKKLFSYLNKVCPNQENRN